MIFLDAVKAVGSEAETIPWHNLINVMSTEVRIKIFVANFETEPSLISPVMAMIINLVTTKSLGGVIGRRRRSGIAACLISRKNL